jgi:hypothetical protein
MRAKAALDTLKAGRWVKMILNYGTDIGRARVWGRTAKFDAAFYMKVGKRLVVKEALLSQPCQPIGQDLGTVPRLETYAELIKTVELSRSDGGQVYKTPNLSRKDGKRIYAHGIYHYQGLHQEERQHLLINGQPVVELDYSGMHPNLLFNKEELPCQADVYAAIMAALGVVATPERRKAIKLITNASFNVERISGFAWMVRKQVDDNGIPLTDVLGASPADLAEAILGVYPALRPYFCTGEWWKWLHWQDSEIMIDALETLAKQGIAGLPVHDSVIAPIIHENAIRLAMEDAYRNQTGFDIYVKK